MPKNRLRKRRRTKRQSRRGPASAARASQVRGLLERLRAVGVALFSERSLAGLLQQVADMARAALGARYAALGVLAASGKSLSQFVTSGLSDDERARIGALPTGHGLLGLVIRKAKPIRTADITRHPKRYGFPEHHPLMKSFLGVPIVSQGKVFGNLYVTDKIGRTEFDAEDEAIAVMLAGYAGVAVRNARLNEATEELVRKVQELQRQRDLIFAMMNHELRNALTGVYGWAERLVRGKSPETAGQAAREVHEGAERAIALMNNFLDLARLEAGKLRPVRRELDVPVVIERAVASVRVTADAKGITVDVRCAEDARALWTDPVRLEEILVNLLSNAVRHSPTGATVALSVRRADSELHFAVIDLGPGIAQEAQARLFEPFERFDPLSGLGTGLGLAVSKRLAHVLGGRLTLASEVGRGATFTLVLPATPGS